MCYRKACYYFPSYEKLVRATSYYMEINELTDLGIVYILIHQKSLAG